MLTAQACADWTAMLTAQVCADGMDMLTAQVCADGTDMLTAQACAEMYRVLGGHMFEWLPSSCVMFSFGSSLQQSGFI